MKLFRKPISEILYKVGALGLVMTGIIFVVMAIYVTYKEINIKENVIKKYGKVILMTLIYVLVLYLIPSIFETEFFSEVGTEGVYFELS